MKSETMKSFHDRMLNCKLKICAHMMKASKLVKNKGKETVLRANCTLFGLMILVAQNRKLQMNKVLKHPLGPLPYLLATSDGLHRKTAKLTLGREVIKPVPLAKSIVMPTASLIHGMAIFQRIARDENTQAEIASAVLALGMAEAGTSRWVNFVFDVYQENTKKDSEREI